MGRIGRRGPSTVASMSAYLRVLVRRQAQDASRIRFAMSTEEFGLLSSGVMQS